MSSVGTCATKSILERVAAGEAAAVEECLAAYGGLVWSLARRLSRNPFDAEDAAQEIFIDVWRNAARFDSAAGSEATFIATIARRRLADRHRRRAREIETAPMDEAAPVPAPERDDALEREEEAARVRAQLARLRPVERRVLELATYHGLSHAEIADATRLPLGTVKTHARRGLQRLRALLEGARGATPGGARKDEDPERT